MMKRKLQYLVLGLALAGMLTACAAKEDAAQPQSEEAPQTEQAKEQPQEESGEQSQPKEEALPKESGKPKDPSFVSVGLVTNSGGIEDQSFNQSAWEGLQWMAGRTGCHVDFLESESAQDVAGNLEKLVAQGDSLCWAIGYESGVAVLQAAADHPDVNFAIIDNSFEETPSNVTGVVFRAQEPSFLAGYIAANVTATDKVGFVGGQKNEVIEQFRCGYMAGVAYAAAEKGRKIEVETAYADSFTDSAKGKELAEGLYQGGCDIVYHAAGQTGIGVIDAAREAGRYVIGVDKDQAYLAPENVLTSVMKYVNEALRQVSEEYLDGKNIGGRTESLGLAEEAMGISENHNLYSDELYEKALQLSEQIVNGGIKVPANESEYDAFVSSL